VNTSYAQNSHVEVAIRIYISQPIFTMTLSHGMNKYL